LQKRKRKKDKQSVLRGGKGIELLTCLLLDNGGFLVALLAGDALGVAHQENDLGMLLDLRATCSICLSKSFT
jgi:hypothetical protein